MTIEQKISEYAQKNGLTLSDKSDIIIKGLEKKDGNCPCRLEPVQCPCPTHMQEIEETGSCHCGLFAKS